METLLGFFLLALVIGLLSLVFLFLQELQRQQPRKKRRPPINKVGMEAISSDLEKELVSRLAGDRVTARRLVKNIQRRNPNRDLVWCWEKAIADLERDRC